MESAVIIQGAAAATALISHTVNHPSPPQQVANPNRLYVTKTTDDGKARRLFAETKLAESDKIIETNRLNKLAAKASDEADIESFNREILGIFHRHEMTNNIATTPHDDVVPNEGFISNEMTVYPTQLNEAEPNDNNDDNKNGLPGYLRQTFTSTLPPYTNQDEVARINNCFRTGSNRSLRSLPAQLGPGSVQSAMREKTTMNLLPKLNATSVVSKSIKKDMKTKDGFFHVVKYTGEEYNKEAVISNMKEECAKVFTESFCRKPFKTSSRYITPKAEDIFSSSGGRTSYPPSILGPSTGFTDFTKITRSECMDSTKFLCGPFRVFTGKEREKDRRLAAQWAHQIFKLILADWGHMKFKVKFTPEDELLVQFILNGSNTTVSSDGATASLPPEQALSKYMNQLASHGIAADFGLKKRGDRWGVVEVGIISAQPSKAGNSLKKGNNTSARGKGGTDDGDGDNGGGGGGRVESTADQEEVSKILLTFSLLAPWAKNGLSLSKEYYAAQSLNKALAKRVAERQLDTLVTAADTRSDDSSMKTTDSGDVSIGIGFHIY